MSDPYTDLMNAAEGSPEHLDAVARISAMERAMVKANENVIKGTGRNGHPYASGGVDVPDARPSYESRSPGPMQQGVASPSFSELIKIGDLETNRDVAEAMRRGMSAEEWTSLTGLPYTSLTQAAPAVPQSRKEREAARADAAMMEGQEALDKLRDLNEMAKAEDDAKQAAQDQELQSYGASILEQVIEQHYGPDLSQGLTRDTVETGEVDMGRLAELGVNETMVAETIEHYTQAAERMLEPVGSSVAYLENFLSDAEAKTVRQAIINHDLGKVQQLGVRARDRAAAMSFEEVDQFLTREEKLKLRLRKHGTMTVVELPKVGATSWANAVTMNLINFK